MGGVLTTRSYDEFIKHNRLLDMVNSISQSVTVGNIDEIKHQNKLNQLRDKIKAGSIPQHIVEELKTMLNSLGILERSTAVRSSASAKASFAGIHESFLNVRGLGNILECVKGCYASLWSNQALVYLSHGAIVAREYGIPAVVNIPGVMRVIKEGSKVVVDGDAGKVFSK